MKRPSRSASRLALLAITALFALSDGGHSAQAAPPGATEANITRLTTNILERSQFSHHVLDRELAGKFLDSYLDGLDGTHSLLLKTDLDEFAAFRNTLAQATRVSGDVGAAQKIFRRYLQRLGERSAFVAETLKTAAFDFSGHENFVIDRDKAPRPLDVNGAHELWLQQLRAEYLQEKLSDTPVAQIAPKLTKRYAQQLDSMKALSDDEVLEIYLNALAHVYDPHSDYLGHAQVESFSISMKLSLFGIGAALELADGFCTIRELVPGSPAARSGALMPGDRIIAVAQAGKEPVDVVNMPLSRTVELIRGPKGTSVTLAIVAASSPDGAPKNVRLVRDEIKLEDQQAKARIQDLPRANGAKLRIGVLDVPGFYADMSGSGGGEHRSVTTDVIKLVARLKKENIQGLVLDLRHNGGGSLKEAISLTGLFIKKGPVVQTRGAEGDVDVESDPDSGVLYDGPLVVLTSRFSASASEILAGALQDYGRALIVGDSQTFGKGTVQSVLPLARLMDQNGLTYTYDPGALKITISKFYRPSGASTQLRGVAADIVVPSLSDFNDVSESALNNPLPWDTVPAASFDRMGRVQPYLGALRDQSARRIKAGKEFAALADDVARLKKNIDSKSVSLNEAERREEMTANKTRRQQREKERASLQAAQPATFELTLKNVSAPTLSPPPAPKPPPQRGNAASSESNDRPAVQDLAQDVILDEGIKILADYTELANGTKLAGTNQPASATH